MRQFHVKVYYRHCAGSSVVEPEASVIIFASSYAVNGIYVDSDWAEFRWSPFGELWLTLPDLSHRHRDLAQPYVDFYESLTPEDCLEGSDFNFAPGVVRSAIRGIPVATLEAVVGLRPEVRAA